MSKIQFEDEEIDFKPPTGKAYLIQFACVFLVLGMLMGYWLAYNINFKTTEDQVDYIEKIMNKSIPFQLVNENMTLAQARNMYQRYYVISKGMLINEIENICGTKVYHRYPIDLNFSEWEVDRLCLDLCS